MNLINLKPKPMTNRNYLATIVVDPRGAEGTNNEMIPKLSEAILQSEGEVLKVEEQGSIDLHILNKRSLFQVTSYNLNSKDRPILLVYSEKNSSLRKKLIV